MSKQQPIHNSTLLLPQQKIKIIGTTKCKNCLEAKKICLEYNLQYIWIDSEENSESKKLIQQIYSTPTLPIIFINEEYLGGLPDLQKFIHTKFSQQQSSQNLNINNKNNNQKYNNNNDTQNAPILQDPRTKTEKLQQHKAITRLSNRNMKLFKLKSLQKSFNNQTNTNIAQEKLSPIELDKQTLQKEIVTNQQENWFGQRKIYTIKKRLFITYYDNISLLKNLEIPQQNQQQNNNTYNLNQNNTNNNNNNNNNNIDIEETNVNPYQTYLNNQTFINSSALSLPKPKQQYQPQQQNQPKIDNVPFQKNQPKKLPLPSQSQLDHEIFDVQNQEFLPLKQYLKQTPEKVLGPSYTPPQKLHHQQYIYQDQQQQQQQNNNNNPQLLQQQYDFKTPIVIIQGFPSYLSEWKQFQTELGQNCARIIHFQIPGFDRIDERRDPSYKGGLEDICKLLKQLLTHLKIDKAILVAPCFSQFILSKFSQMYPSTVAGSAIIGSIGMYPDKYTQDVYNYLLKQFNTSHKNLAQNKEEIYKLLNNTETRFLIKKQISKQYPNRTIPEIIALMKIHLSYPNGLEGLYEQHRTAPKQIQFIASGINNNLQGNQYLYTGSMFNHYFNNNLLQNTQQTETNFPLSLKLNQTQQTIFLRKIGRKLINFQSHLFNFNNLQENFMFFLENTNQRKLTQVYNELANPFYVYMALVDTLQQNQEKQIKPSL